MPIYADGVRRKCPVIINPFAKYVDYGNKPVYELYMTTIQFVCCFCVVSTSVYGLYGLLWKIRFVCRSVCDCTAKLSNRFEWNLTEVICKTEGLSIISLQ